MYNIPNEVQIGTLRVSLLCEHWCSVLPTDSTGAFFGYIYILIEHLLHSPKSAVSAKQKVVK